MTARRTVGRGNAKSIVHYYLGRPVDVWIAANSRRSPALRAHEDSGECRPDLVLDGDEVLPSAPVS